MKTPETLKEADLVFREYAGLHLRLAAEAARLDKRIESLKSAYAEDTAIDQARHDELQHVMESFCTTHPDLFQARKKHKDPAGYGEYGLQLSTRAEIDPEFDAQAEGDRLGLPFATVKIGVNTAAVRDALIAGESVRGARLVACDKVLLKVTKTIEEARND